MSRTNSSWRPWGDHPIVVSITLLAAVIGVLIAIFTFLKENKSFIPWFAQAPLPKADPQRFAVALAHFEHDKDQQYERLIREVLKDFEGVQLLQFDRTISLAGTKPEESEKEGHTQARQYLEDSGAHVLIWGLVLNLDGKSAPHLYWTTLEARKRAKEPYQPENFKLPALFWSDLAEVLRLVVATQYSKFLAQEGHFIADQLTPFVARVRWLLDKSAGGREGGVQSSLFLVTPSARWESRTERIRRWKRRWRRTRLH